MKVPGSSLWPSEKVGKGVAKMRVDEWGFGCFRFICIIVLVHFVSFSMICISIFFRAMVGDGRFITLVMVKKTGNSSSDSPAEWIWSDLFSWISYEFGNERCMHWYRNQPPPEIYLGKTRNLKS